MDCFSFFISLHLMMYSMYVNEITICQPQNILTFISGTSPENFIFRNIYFVNGENEFIFSSQTGCQHSFITVTIQITFLFDAGISLAQYKLDLFMVFNNDFVFSTGVSDSKHFYYSPVPEAHIICYNCTTYQGKMRWWFHQAPHQGATRGAVTQRA
ncbi:hypothetical protein ACJX0J_033259 [Zea mays]